MQARYLSDVVGNIIDGPRVVVVEPGHPRWTEFLALNPAPSAADDPIPGRPLAPVSLAQIVAVLIADAVLTEDQGLGWLAGTLPPQVAAVIDTLPEDQRIYARLRAIRPAEVNPADPLITALAHGLGHDAEAVADWFTRAAALTA